MPEVEQAVQRTSMFAVKQKEHQTLKLEMLQAAAAAVAEAEWAVTRTSTWMRMHLQNRTKKSRMLMTSSVVVAMAAPCVEVAVVAAKVVVLAQVVQVEVAQKTSTFVTKQGHCQTSKLEKMQA